MVESDVVGDPSVSSSPQEVVLRRTVLRLRSLEGAMAGAATTACAAVHAAYAGMESLR